MSLFRFSTVPMALAGLLGSVLHPIPSAAQTSAWITPSDGYVHDSFHRSIRVLSGFIGAAVLGPSVAEGVDWVSIAPNQKSALADRNGSRVWIPDLAAAEQSQTLDGIPRARQALWARDSSRAVLLTERNRLIWLSMSGSASFHAAEWDLERHSHAGLLRGEGPPVLLAADASADQVLLASREGSTWHIWLASTTLPPVIIPFSGHAVAAAFAPGDGGVFIADAAARRVVRIQNLEMAPVLTPLLSSDAYVGDPSAMVLSSDGKRLFLADRAGKVIRVFDSPSGDLMAQMPTDTPPDSLTNIATDRFLLNSGASWSPGQALIFLDTQAPAKLSFVPGGN